MKKLLIFFTFTALHLVAIGVIIYSFLPIAKWYLNFRPIWGVDFYNTVSFVEFLKNHLTWPSAGWLYFWFAGFPLMAGYPLLHFYFILPFTYFFDLVYSVQIWAMVATALFAVGSYFLFFVISRNIVLSIVLAIATVFSGGVYQTLTWAGSIPAYSTQAFFPWVTGFIVLYNTKENFRYLLAAALIAGFSILGHQQVFIVYIFPAVTLLLFLNFNRGFAILAKLKSLAVFLFIAGMIGLPLVYSQIGTAAQVILKPGYTQQALSTTTRAPTETEINLAKFNKQQVIRMVTDNHDAIFILLAISIAFFIAAFLFRRKLSLLLVILPHVVIAGYFAFYIWLFGQGISIFHGGWYRLFWSVPVWIGAVASVFWYVANVMVSETLRSKILKIFIFLYLNFFIAIIGWFLLYGAHFSAIWQTIYRSQVSSAHPDVLNVETTAADYQRLRAKMIPNWLDGNNTNFRIYNGDQTVNLWWNGFYKMPSARGYLDPPITNQQRGYLFWLDSALSETDGQPQLVKAFGYPAETTTSNALFLLDWNAIRFFEGGHSGGATVPVPVYLRSNLTGSETVIDLNEKRYSKHNVTLNYSEFAQDLVSPILAATNTSTIGIFASDGGYETVVRAIAERDNLNSQKIIPIKLGRFVDKYNLATLKNFDTLYLYDYDYKNFEKTFKMLENYLKDGKKVFIETGVEVKQSDGVLPEFFPIKRVERRGLGKDWDLKNPEKLFGSNVNPAEFSPPIFDETEWKMSSAVESDVRDGTKIVLTNHGKVVMASQRLGSGEVVWSGLNFAYHILRNHNGTEAKFFQNILADAVSLEKKSAPKSNVNFLNSNTRTIETEGARGILFKEQAFSGWQAKLIKSGSGKTGNLKIFKAGPAYPGFIYVPLPDVGKTKVEFVFRGSVQNSILALISFLTVLMVFDEIVLNGFFLGRIRSKIWKKVTKKISSWWEKEEEELDIAPLV